MLEPSDATPCLHVAIALEWTGYQGRRNSGEAATEQMMSYSYTARKPEAAFMFHYLLKSRRHCERFRQSRIRIRGTSFGQATAHRSPWSATGSGAFGDCSK